MTSARILIAEDEKHIRLALSLLLRQLGHDVTAVQDGAEALLKLIQREKAGDQFDLVITDVQMPHVDGLQLLDRIKEHKIAVPVIVITGYGNKEIAHDLKSKHYAAYIDKPFIPDELLEKVENVLFQRPELAAQAVS